MPKQETSLDALARKHNEQAAIDVYDSFMRQADVALAMVRSELCRAIAKHPTGFHSGHEGYAVILEELEELFEDVRRDDLTAAKMEAVQVAAMAIRFMLDLSDKAAGT